MTRLDGRGTGAGAAAVAATPLRVMAFAGAHNLPLFTAEAAGFFAGRGLAVTVSTAPNSKLLRDGLAEGRFDLVHAAVDNAFAMVDGGADILVVAGGDSSMNTLFVQPGIADVAALAGRTVAVDAPDTAYALQLGAILRRRGLAAGTDYHVEPVGSTAQRVHALLARPDLAATMLNPPYSLIAEDRGLRNLGAAAELLGAYQGIAVFTLRRWAAEHADHLRSYLAALIEGQRQALADPEGSIRLLAERLELDGDVAARTFAAAADPARGLSPDLRLDFAGLRSVLAIRAAATGRGEPDRPERYLDTSFYEQALADAGTTTSV